MHFEVESEHVFARVLDSLNLTWKKRLANTKSQKACCMVEFSKRWTRPFPRALTRRQAVGGTTPGAEAVTAAEHTTSGVPDQGLDGFTAEQPRIGPTPAEAPERAGLSPVEALQALVIGTVNWENGLGSPTPTPQKTLRISGAVGANLDLRVAVETHIKGPPTWVVSNRGENFQLPDQPTTLTLDEAKELLNALNSNLRLIQSISAERRSFGPSFQPEDISQLVVKHMRHLSDEQRSAAAQIMWKSLSDIGWISKPITDNVEVLIDALRAFIKLHP